MKNIIYAIFLLISHITIYGQRDTIPDSINHSINLQDCAHGHICCYVGCYCCPEGRNVYNTIPDSIIFNSSNDSINISQPPIKTDYSKVIYPENDGLTYNQYIGESIAGFHLADGWRIDSINGGFNKEIYDNPYISSIGFEKQKGERMIAYRYENGKLFNGRVTETFTVRFIPKRVAGNLPDGQPYYESKDVTLEFSADCVDGLLQGRSVLLGMVPQFGLYNKLPLSECYFENGEIVGVCKFWDLNSVEFVIRNGNIYSNVKKYDYFAFRELLELSEITYAKGNPDYIKHVIYKRNKRTGKIKAIEQKIPKNTN